MTDTSFQDGHVLAHAGHTLPNAGAPILAHTSDGGVLRYRSIYKTDANGKLRVWFMDRQGCKHRVVAGFDGGSLVENAWTTCVSKGKGKAQTTPEEQAIKEIEALYKKALERDYYETPEAACGPPRNYLPMLAEGWKDTTWDKWTARLNKAGILIPAGETGVYFQPKLDGYCCVGRDQGLQSREGLPIPTAEHIMDMLEPLRRRHPNKPVHGELYNHELREDFEQLGSFLKRTKDVTPEHVQAVARSVQYHIYDWPGWGEDKPFGERSYALYNELADLGLWGEMIRYVPTTKVVDEAHLLALTAQAVEDGYEGGIGRLHLPYEKAKRSWSVLKIKTFDDAEFFVVRVEEGKGNYAGFAKRVVCWLPDADRTLEPTPETTFEAGIKGKKDTWLKDLLTANHKVVTIKFFGYTQGGAGKPRFGVATKWHGEARTL